MKYIPLFGPNDYRKIVTLRQLEELTGLKRSTLRTWLADGTIPAIRSKKGGRWHFRREALEAWWKDLQSQNEK